ncbi:MAG: DUF1810 domain-containing protein [Xenococcus sp. (in: cyanobacteria)]
MFRDLINDTYNLRRFIEAQDRCYESVLEELKFGQKRGHWMWYIFPQIKGLGRSAMAQKYAISSQEEAKAYSEHSILGLRLRECTQLVINIEGRSAKQIFHYPDNLKFRSCMTLFYYSAIDNSIFRNALLKYFDGKPDHLTLDILKKK